MLRLIAWTMVPILAASIAASADDRDKDKDKDKPGPTIAGWGRPVDPDGDCKVRAVGDKLLMDVPGSKHDLSVEANAVNAPRVIRPIEGDFIAQVKIGGNVVHNGKTTSDTFHPYHGAGLLIWVDGRTYVRFERAVTLRPNGEFIHYANFELRKDGARTEGHHVEIPVEDATLRIERRGDLVYALVSGDGINWTSLAPIEIKLPKEVMLGVAAVSTSTDPFSPEFTDFDVFKREIKGSAR